MTTDRIRTLAEAAAKARGTDQYPAALKALHCAMIDRRLEGRTFGAPYKDDEHGNRLFARACMLRDEAGRARSSGQHVLAKALAEEHEAALASFKRHQERRRAAGYKAPAQLSAPPSRAMAEARRSLASAELDRCSEQLSKAAKALRFAKTQGQPLLVKLARREYAKAQRAALAARHEQDALRRAGDSILADHHRMQAAKFRRLADAPVAPQEGMLPEEQIAELLKRIVRGDEDPSALLDQIGQLATDVGPYESVPGGPNLDDLLAQGRAAVMANDDEALLEVAQALVELFGIDPGEVEVRGPAPRAERMARALYAVSVRAGDRDGVRQATATLQALRKQPASWSGLVDR